MGKGLGGHYPHPNPAGAMLTNYMRSLELELGLGEAAAKRQWGDAHLRRGEDAHLLAPPPTVMYVDESDGNEDDLVGSNHGCAEFRGDESTRPLVLSAAGRGIHVLGVGCGNSRLEDISCMCSPALGDQYIYSVVNMCFVSYRSPPRVMCIIDQPILRERWVGVNGKKTTLNGQEVCPQLFHVSLYISSLLFHGIGMPTADGAALLPKGHPAAAGDSLPSKHDTLPSRMLGVVVLQIWHCCSVHLTQSVAAAFHVVSLPTNVIIYHSMKNCKEEDNRAATRADNWPVNAAKFS
ncbi:hypothetical protein VPH35_049501 [Triticum aestivum]|uniref:Uncharacterized protein n=1 Tax=Triticum aestivum TaxID=4565 RepID=A0A077RPS0_WHEAT|nr:unnamed protein product [Triticum aestivum]